MSRNGSQVQPGSASSSRTRCGANFPDALGAGALAGAYDAPVLLVPPKGMLPSSVAAEVARLGAARAIVLGGTGAVSDAMASQVRTALAPGRTLTRYGGANRYATARLAALAAKAQWVAGGRTFPRSAFVVSGLQVNEKKMRENIDIGMAEGAQDALGHSLARLLERAMRRS